MLEEIDAKIEELTRKADAAQKAGNLEAMSEYDKQIRALQDEKIEILKNLYPIEDNDNKPKTL